MARITRRKFVQSLATAVAAPAVVMAAKRPKPLPIAFSTLGCPKWDWQTILEQAYELGYAAIELRGIQGEMDLTRRPEFSAARLKQSMRDLEALDLRISDLGASTRLHEPDSAKRAAQLDEGKRFIELAHRLNVPYVRVFGNNWVKEESKQVTMERIVEGLRLLQAQAKGSGVEIILESHGDFTESPILKEILSRSGVGLLWDTHHTVVSGKETPAHTYQQLSRYIRHTHLKDSKPEGNGIRYVLTGTGTVPVREIVRVLVAGGYRGVYCFEWEKVWHPEIEEPEVAFPHYAKIMRGYLKDEG
jgi:sugar phosphate isomerase/epimerase